MHEGQGLRTELHLNGFSERETWNKREEQKAGKVCKEGINVTSLSLLSSGCCDKSPLLVLRGCDKPKNPKGSTGGDISEHQIFVTGWQPGTCVTERCHPALGLGTLHSHCCGSGEVFQQNQGFSCQGLGKHTPEEIWDGDNQELALPILLPASGCEQPARGWSGAPGAPCSPDVFHPHWQRAVCAAWMLLPRSQTHESAKLGKQMLGKISLY